MNHPGCSGQRMTPTISSAAVDLAGGAGRLVLPAFRHEAAIDHDHAAAASRAGANTQ